MVNYSQGKIYQVVANSGGADGDVYIGSTCKQYLSQRMDQHRSNYKGWKAGKYHKVTVFDVFDKYGVENCCIVLLELVNATTIDELRARERHWIQSTACVNKHIPGRSDVQYRVDNREHISQRKAHYYVDNREQLLQYYVDNREQVLARVSKYRDDNREQINIKQSEKIQCECGCNVRRGHMSRHKKTQKHRALTEATHL